jgi:hypothetical protein
VIETGWRRVSSAVSFGICFRELQREEGASARGYISYLGRTMTADAAACPELGCSLSLS